MAARRRRTGERRTGGDGQRGPLFFIRLTYHHEVVDLLLGKLANPATAKVFLGKASEASAVEFFDLVAEMLEDATNDTVAAGMQSHANNRAVLSTLVLNIIDGDGAILKHNAFHHLFHIGLGNRAVALDLIYFVDIRRRVSETLSHLAIVGEKQKTSSVFVQSADRINAFLATTLDE